MTLIRSPEADIPEIVHEIVEDPVKFAQVEREPVEIEDFREIKTLFINKEMERSNLAILNDEFQDIVIAGDTHGFLNSTLHIVKPFLEKKVDSLVFLGDYVDRGPHSLINFIYLLCLLLTWPERVILLRGNHEDLSLNDYYGFRDELSTLYPSIEYKKIAGIMEEIYEYLSLAAITPSRSIAVHAGIPQKLKEIQEIEQIPKPHSAMVQKFRSPKELLKFYPILEQLRWNDPRIGQDKRFTPSNRGENIYFFNQEVVKDFLRHSNANRIIRSHESRRGGYANLFNGNLIHIFSTEPYFGYVKKAYILHEASNGMSFVRDLGFKVIEEF